MDTRRVLPTASESRASPRCHELAADEDGSRRRLARDVRSLICCSIRYPSTRRGAARRGMTVTAHCGLLVWAVSSVCVSPSLAVGSYMVTRRDRRAIARLSRAASNPRDARFRLTRGCTVSYPLQNAAVTYRRVHTRRVMRLPRWC